MVLGKFYLVVGTLVLFTFHNVQAQVIEVLPSSGSYEEEAFDSSRYQKKPRLGPSVQVKPSKTATQKRKKTKPKFQLIPDIQQEKTEPKPNPAREDLVQEENSGFVDDVQGLVMGGTVEEIHKYQKKLDKDDIRHNFIEIGIGTSYYYNESKSNYWFREYITSAPALDLETKIWFGPFFGLKVGYMTSVGASVKNEYGTNSRTKSTDQWIEVDLVSRRFFKKDDRAPSLEFSLGYYGYQRRVPSDEDQRMKLASQAINLAYDGRWPDKDGDAWKMGFSIRPVVWHSEGKTGINAKSGKSNESFGFESRLGQEFKFDRQNRLYWNLKFLYEKNQFSGNSMKTDPSTGSDISDVSVDTHFLFLELGFIWGN